MRSIRNIALAAGALALAGAAFADEAKKPEAQTKPQARHEHPHQAMGMHGMRERCHGEPRGQSRDEHQH